jgi:hypothetical protein
MFLKWDRAKDALFYGKVGYKNIKFDKVKNYYPTQTL